MGMGIEILLPRQPCVAGGEIKPPQFVGIRDDLRQFRNYSVTKLANLKIDTLFMDLR